MNIPSNWHVYERADGTTTVQGYGSGYAAGRIVGVIKTTEQQHINKWFAEATLRTPPRSWPTGTSATGKMMLMGRNEVRHLGEFNSKQEALDAIVAEHIKHKLELA